MKRFNNMIDGGRSISSSKTRHFNHLQSAAEQAEVENITVQKLKFASLHEEEDGDDDDDDDDDDAARRPRQSPKKIGKVSSSKNVVNSHQQKFVCYKCGKAFQSSKAMCGHMACHSQKQKPSSKPVAKKRVLMDSESDTESVAVKMKRRSLYKKNDYVVTDSNAAKFDMVTNCSSEEASGIEQEQEEVAICLMMLSRDSANWGGLNSICDSSDNNSVVLEDRSTSTRLGNKDGLSSGYDMNEAKDNSKKKIESLGDFDARYARNVARNVETGVKIRSFTMNKMEQELISEPHLSLKKLKSLMDGDRCLAKGALNGSSCSTDLCNRIEQKEKANVACNNGSPYETTGKNSLVADKRKGKGILDVKLGDEGNDWKKGKYETMACCFNNCGRVHLDLGKESEANNTNEVPANFKRNGTRSHCFIDLNLPAPIEDEEANESMGSHRDL